jgi:hypothetical protein
MALRESNLSPAPELDIHGSANQVKAPRRKRLLINPLFQAVFALYTFATTLLMVPIFFAANFYFIHKFAETAEKLGLAPDNQLLQFVRHQQTLMTVVFIVATALALFINIVFSFIFSNRISGSIYRLTSEMNQTDDLNTARKINARKFDFFQETFLAYNQLMDRLKP